MIYSIFIKKTKYDVAPFLHVQLLKNILGRTNNHFLIGWPGYIGTTKNTIDDFYNLLNPFGPGQQLHGFFFRPLNFSYSPVFLSFTNEDYLNLLFGNHTIHQPYLDDHSKILVILSVNLTHYNCYETAIAQNDFEVVAILLGSSNQSYNTYFKSPTPKGEADVLLLNIGRNGHTLDATPDRELLGEALGRELLNSLIENDNVVIAKEIEGSERNLNTIFRNIVEGEH